MVQPGAPAQWLEVCDTGAAPSSGSNGYFGETDGVVRGGPEQESGSLEQDGAGLVIGEQCLVQSGKGNTRNG